MTLLPKIHVDQLRLFYKKLSVLLQRNVLHPHIDNTLHKVPSKVDAIHFCAIVLAHFWMRNQTKIELETQREPKRVTSNFFPKESDLNSSPC